MFGLFKKNKESYRSFGTGTVLALKDVPDQVFSTKMMGDGYALELTEGKVYAPISGDVTLVFPTGHAFGITDASGVEMLIHLGIDTVELNGKGFNGVVKQGDKVNQGDLLTTVDLDYIRENGKSLISPFILTSGQSITLLKEGESVTSESEDIFSINA
ncbi:PTS glucose transporter subunit IIA [Erysipelothrix rhusiopathiae]|uniref:PTS sugar transporter subunit IIA n=1 Tax=Erysipelothrix rhusiopathiae TaxID=1648 RepID=UPI00202B136A|nr:PTS glucose transporter subunit IIA [Erysipelothrix rhusiopathiae]URQ77910.1 PTS glucose transporter subunit IIA [Erysipelothrix rhusiopathiae]